MTQEHESQARLREAYDAKHAETHALVAELVEPFVTRHDGTVAIDRAKFYAADPAKLLEFVDGVIDLQRLLEELVELEEQLGP